VRISAPANAGVTRRARTLQNVRSQSAPETRAALSSSVPICMAAGAAGPDALGRARTEKPTMAATRVPCPGAFGSVAPAAMQIGTELDNAARVSGADWLRTFWSVLARLVTPAFAGALILTFVIILKEYSPAVFLASAESNVIGTTMLELWKQGNTGSVAALATLQIAITVAFVGLAGLLMRSKAEERGDHA